MKDFLGSIYNFFCDIGEAFLIFIGLALVVIVFVLVLLLLSYLVDYRIIQVIDAVLFLAIIGILIK